ncbi:thiaminase II [Rhizobiaceae bacterium BDR2-2]|uniref:Aminopyrimidine aminohydrolase n=1 Tax=Ectorhizobium quercum TaxID=2965071 RepID=A0AAE3N2Y1_9HYPH|nr:thiaminase II [Ectorhizobium quercum]MCX8998941.1 thiaminase II [Ectorhizobium quercum]
MTDTPFERLKQTCRSDWQAYCEHDFIRRLARGTLPAEAFRHYLKQDYLFLVHFARAWGLAVYKSGDLGKIRSALATLKTIVDIEIDLHVSYCREWGISPADLADLPEARPTMAYTRYVLDAGHRGDLLDLHVALAPCVVGYAEIGRWIVAQPFTVLDANPYAEWVRMYAGDEFQEAAAAEVDWLNARLGAASPERFAALSRTFRDATRLEIDFWQMGLDLRM